jgi:hypothetical protein
MAKGGDRVDSVCMTSRDYSLMYLYVRSTAWSPVSRALCTYIAHHLNHALTPTPVLMPSAECHHPSGTSTLLPSSSTTSHAPSTSKARRK